MSERCADPVRCPGGSCSGCQGGVVWCQDPRCSPYCPGHECVMKQDHDFNGTMVVIIVLFCLVTMLFIVWFVYGPGLFEPHSDHIRGNVIVPEEYLIK